MEFHLRLARPIENLWTVRDSVLSADPSAVVDTAADGMTLRIAAVLGPEDLARSLGRAGVAATADDILIIPSVCCGGCSG